MTAMSLLAGLYPDDDLRAYLLRLRCGPQPGMRRVDVVGRSMLVGSRVVVFTTNDSAYPAAPDSEYGWEKLFSERLYFAYGRNYGIEARVARFHNIFGPEGTWTGGKEKAPAAMCRKVAMTANGGEIEIWGDGLQTRSFLFIDECIDGVLRLTRSNFAGPVNIGSDEMVTIDQLVDMVADISGKRIDKNHIAGPTGVSSVSAKALAVPPA